MGNIINYRYDFQKVDNEKIKKMVSFFNEFALDYLEDGTKNKLIQEIEKGNPKTILEIMKPMTPEWKKRVEELGYFRVFTDYRNKLSSEDHDCYNVTFMDSSKSQHIPTLKKVVIRERDNFDIPRI